MMRHRFRAADPSEGCSLRNDGGVDPSGRSRRLFGVSLMPAGGRSRFFTKAEDAGRGRAMPQQTKMPHITALRLDWLFTPTRRERTRRLPAVGEVTTFTQP
jgi:hypothetical protein